MYLIMAIAGAFGIMIIPSQLVVQGDAAATASNIADREFLFRLGIFSSLLAQTVFLFLGLALYRLFVQVSKSLALTLLTLVTAAVPIAYFIIFNQLFALFVLHEPSMAAFAPEQRDTMILSFMNRYQYGNAVIGIFWGLWLIPFGQLVIKSGFIPKLFGIFLIVGGISYLADATAFVLFPSIQAVTNMIVGISSSIAELAMVIWLLVWGVRPKQNSPEVVNIA
ncbi:DUF4386 domain-containing protein [Parapedobacter sp. DT-150]|uniref:DUF4386 domain-containing protein n=1 Tax=Parapedobacter sp. DT-150 TaxID=3396162 RepID=UPI003F1DAF0C